MAEAAEGETFAQLRKLFEQYLPTVPMPATGRAALLTTFVEAFEEKYFPLCEYFTSCVDDDPAHAAAEITDTVSFQCMGLSYDYYHEGPEVSHPESSIFMLLVDLSNHQNFPFALEEAEEVKTAWLDVLDDIVRAETLARIPAGGFPLAKIEAATAGTNRENLGAVARHLLADTDNIFLDSSYIEEEYPSYSDPWEPETVKLLAANWKEAQALWSKIKSEELAAHADPERYLQQVLDLLQTQAAPPSTE